MTFVSLGFLLAALAAAIPVVLHMVNRQKAKKLPFSTLRFLRISVQKTRRRKRVHDLLLMLLRMAVLVLIAVGLAEPTITNLKSFWGGGQSAVAIVLDNSTSMGTIDQGRARFETAREAAVEIMDQLQEGDQAALLLTGGREFANAGRLDRTHDKVLEIIDQAEVSYQRADLSSRVQEAQRLLAGTKAQNKQIYVISDLQKLSWEGLAQEATHAAPQAEDAAPAKAQAREEQVGDVPVIFIDCLRAPKPDVAVSGLDLKAAVPVAGLPISLTAELFNASPAAEQRHLELHIDGVKETASPIIDIKPGERARHDFQFVFSRGGLHRGEVRLVGDDGSKYNDRRFFALEVNQGVPVAVVKPEKHEIAYLEDSFYVESALAPTAGAPIRVTPLTAADLMSEPLAAYSVVFCVNLPALEPDAAARLRQYVAGGGNLVWISGDNVDPAAYNQMNDAAQGALLPAKLIEVRAPEPGAQRDTWNIASLDTSHRALAPLAEPASLYQSVLVYKHVRLDPGTTGATVLARLDDGEPLLVQRSVDRGTVTLLGTSAHVGWTNLPLRPVFLPLLVRMTFELAGTERARHQVLAGAPLVLEVDSAQGSAGVEIVPPSGETFRLKAQSKTADGRPVFAYENTFDVGVYLLRPLQAARPTQIAYSVNGDPDEADPATIARQELEERFAGTTLVFADDPEDLSSTFRKLRQGESLWELLLAAVLVVLVFETLISNWLSSKKNDAELEKLAPGTRRLAKRGRGAAGPGREPGVESWELQP